MAICCPVCDLPEGDWDRQALDRIARIYLRSDESATIEIRRRPKQFPRIDLVRRESIGDARTYERG